MKRRKGWRMSSIITITISSAHSPGFRHFTYVTTHSPTLPSIYLRHSSFSNPSVASPASQFILKPFFRFSYATSSSLNSPCEPAMGLADDFKYSKFIRFINQIYRALCYKCKFLKNGRMFSLVISLYNSDHIITNHP